MEKISIGEVEHIIFTSTRKRWTFDEPIPSFKTRYPGILESCLFTPFQTFDKKFLYPTFISKLSILFYLMNKNHPFVNGNKRIAMMTLFYVLYKEDKWLIVTSRALYAFAVGVAASPSPAKKEQIKYIEKFFKTYITSWDEAVKIIPKNPPLAE